jgi:hypothetical protein
MTTTDEALAPNRSTSKHATEGGKQMRTFNYGQVVSLKLSFAGVPMTRQFYCVDQVTTDVIRSLAEEMEFPEWDQSKPDFWHRKAPEDSLWVSETSQGWLSLRGYRVVTKALTHESYIMPILFPGPEMALAAGELCYPRPHPALYWDAYYYGGALGNVVWERSLPDEVWAHLMIKYNRKQDSSHPATLDNVVGAALESANNLYFDPTANKH